MRRFGRFGWVTTGSVSLLAMSFVACGIGPKHEDPADRALEPSPMTDTGTGSTVDSSNPTSADTGARDGGLTSDAMPLPPDASGDGSRDDSMSGSDAVIETSDAVGDAASDAVDGEVDGAVVDGGGADAASDGGVTETSGGG